MIQEPEAFNTAIQGLLSSRQQSIDMKSNAGGDHLCFMGSGKEEEDQYIHMIISLFLQKNHGYVSQLSGGYQAMHDYFEDYMMDYLDDHNKDKCLVCLNYLNNSKLSESSDKNLPLMMQGHRNLKLMDNGANTSSHLFSKFSAIMRFKGAEVKGKLMDILNNPSTLNGKGDPGNHHVSPSERINKRYRQESAVFSIDGRGDTENHQSDHLNSSPEKECKKSKKTVNLNNYLNSPDIQYSFKCQEVHEDGCIFESRLVVTKSQLIVLRELGGGQADIMFCRPLVSIVKITSKRRHPDLITFKYGHAQGNSLVITEIDRFIIPNSNEVTTQLSKYIVKILDGTTIDVK